MLRPENGGLAGKTSLSPHVKGSRTALDSGFNAVDSGFLVLDSSLRQWNLESRFQSFWDFRFLELYSVFQSPGFHRSTNMNFQHFGIRIPLHGAIIGGPLTITLATQAGQIRERLSIRLQNVRIFGYSSTLYARTVKQKLKTES